MELTLRGETIQLQEIGKINQGCDGWDTYLLATCPDILIEDDLIDLQDIFSDVFNVSLKHDVFCSYVTVSIMEANTAIVKVCYRYDN